LNIGFVKRKNNETYPDSNNLMRLVILLRLIAVAAGLVGGALVGDAMNRAEERRQIEKIRRENERLRWERSQR